MKENPKFEEIAHDALEGIVIFIMMRRIFDLMNAFHRTDSEGTNEEK